MKFANVGLWLMVGVAVLMMTACNSGLAAMEPQVIVVTATPTATPEVAVG